MVCGATEAGHLETESWLQYRWGWEWLSTLCILVDHAASVPEWKSGGTVER